MNRRKMIKAPNFCWKSITLLVVAALVMASAGVYYVFLKNRQIELARKIEHCENKIAEYEYDIRGLQSRQDEVLDRYLMRDRLEQMNSQMVEIPGKVIEKIDSMIIQKRVTDKLVINPRHD